MTLTYCVTNELAPQAMAAVYGAVMAITGVLFIAPIKVKKLSLKGNLAVALVGLAVLLAVFALNGRF